MELSGIYAIDLVALFTAVLVDGEKDEELSPGPKPAAPAQPKLHAFWRNTVPRFDLRPMFGG